MIKKEFLGQSLSYKRHEWPLHSFPDGTYFINHTKKGRGPTSFHPPQVARANEVWNVLVAFPMDSEAIMESGLGPAVSYSAFPKVSGLS